VGALGSVLGGIIGALGAAVAVYLMLHGQRAEETDKISNGAVREVMEFSRFAVGNLEICENIHSSKVTIPRADFPEVMRTPDPIVYPAIADRIGVLKSPQRVVAYYTRIAEAHRMALVLMKQPVALTLTHVLPKEAEHIADIWINICDLAAKIIDSADFKSELDHEAAKIFRKRIDDALITARNTFPDAESFKELS